MILGDIEKLKASLGQFSHVRQRDDYGWGEPSLNLIDCVLSLNRPYLKQVVPRVIRFRQRYPQIRSLTELRQCMETEGGRQDFMERALDYRDLDRARVLSDVCTYFEAIVDNCDASTDVECLASWAASVVPSDYRGVGVKGFGPAGFQYWRMFCGVQTVKPDKYIQEFVAQVLEQKVNPLTSVALLEQASAELGLPLREVDAEIWAKRSGGSVVYGGRIEKADSF